MAFFHQYLDKWEQGFANLYQISHEFKQGLQKVRHEVAEKSRMILLQPETDKKSKSHKKTTNSHDHSKGKGKDKVKPERPKPSFLSAFQRYQQEMESNVRKSLPVGTASDTVVVVLNHMWKGAPAHVRDKYEEAERADRMRYDAQVREY